MKNILPLLTALVLYACSPSYTSYVNPMIGTGGHGHTYPGATVPNGMVQLSPDTRLVGWDACSGYHYSDSTIIGFSHTHLNGTGIGDYADILFMPTVECDRLVAGVDTIPGSGYRSRFSHANEFARPGYYSVLLDDYNVRAELTATLRAGMHRYTFPCTDQAAVLVDLTHLLRNQKNLDLELRMIDDRRIEGMKISRGWAKYQPVYFYAEFSKPFRPELFRNGKIVNDEFAKGKDIKARLHFKTEEGEQIVAKIGLSAVDCEGARKNLMAEIPDWDFDAVAAAADKAWNKRLAKIDIETKNPTQKRIFYTAMYHAMLNPSIFIDIDNRYRGQDLKIHTSPQGEYYTIFSLWDTFRALHPLLTIIEPELNEAFVRTLIRKYEEGGSLPMWDLASNYTGTMIGYHAVSVITEAYMKGARNFDAQKAFEACVKASRYHDFSIENRENGLNTNIVMPIGKLYKDSLTYIPCDLDVEAVAKGLEYAYNDWCISQFARALGKEAEYAEYNLKGEYYKNYFNEATGFMQGKMQNGSWRTPFNPRALNHRKDDYCEGNAWQWSWFVPHDVGQLVELHGGRERFIMKLDSLFTISSQLEGPQISGDITGLIGQYAHGNEPGHHTVHLYNYVGESWKTQRLADTILYNLYLDAPDGLAGNEDCGQMSAWYILNSIGFYPVAPTDGIYSVGRPLFDRVRISLPGGKKLIVKTINNSQENKYIQKMTVNGIEQNRPWLEHDTIMRGGTIEFTMGPEPNHDFGCIQ